MENPATKYPEFGPWDGIDESGEGGPKKLRDALNVVFRRGHLMRRPGRRIVAVDADGRRVAGLHEHATASGGRSVIAYFDPAGANAGGLSRLDWNAGATVDVAMPPEVASVEPGRFTSAVSMDGHTIIAEPGGALLAFDGATLALLAAVPGVDAGVENESYLTSPPRAAFLSVWRDRVVAAGAPDAPRTIGFSENKWTEANIPDDAPIGGANVWPGRTNFDVNTDDGDTVEGVSVLFDRLFVPGRTGIAVVDEDDVAPYARQVARQHGCIAPRSVRNIGDGLIYLGERNVLHYDGVARPVPVSDALPRTMEEVIDWDSAHGSVAVHLRQTTEYRVWVPVKGLPGNQLCLAYNYVQKTWRKASHWYLFDVAARRDLPYKFDVTAALAVILENGREALLTGDSAGRIWLEDVGEDDEGQIFPAFAAMSPVSHGAEWETLTDWQVDCVHDGSYVAGLAVIEGRDVEQEIVRVLAGELVANPATDDIPYAIERALEAGQQTWATVQAWPMTVSGPKVTRLSLGVRQRTRKIQPVLLLPGQKGAAIDPTPGGIRRLELGARPRGGRRT